MNCRTHKAAIIDLARGVDVDPAVERLCRDHMAACPACAAACATQVDLTAELGQLASSVEMPASLAALEDRLLQAMADSSGAPARPTAHRPVHAWRWWAAAAALAVMGLGGWLAAGTWRAPDGQAAAAVMARGDTSIPSTAGPGTAAVPPGPTRPAVGEPASVAAGPAARPEALPVRRPPVPEAPVRDDSVMRFVSLPSAAGLPVLESGRIVRVELPVSMLPDYGINVEPDGVTRVVEADVLVGQDGQPRAIRFVSPDEDPRRRR
jgi:hypothetical protein